jgi:hypothetical protein
MGQKKVYNKNVLILLAIEVNKIEYSELSDVLFNEERREN